MKALIISGGHIDREFFGEFLLNHSYDYIIGVDKGIEACHQFDLCPTVILGDFDSVDPKILRLYEGKPSVKILQYEPEKDDTDTQMAVKHAMEVGCTQITLTGATGSRIDHLLGNIFCLYEPLEAGIECCLLDKNNKIMLLNKSYQLKKKEQYGYYVSLLPFTEVVSGVTLSGFKYPLTDYALTKRSGGLGVSNEILEEIAEIDFQSGILIMIQSKD